MAFKLVLMYRGQELVHRTNNTDNGDEAMNLCRTFAREVTPVMKQLPEFRRISVDDLELRISRL